LLAALKKIDTTEILENEHQVSPGVASGRLHPASAGTSMASEPLPGQAFVQRSSACRATLSLVAAPDPGPDLKLFHNNGK